MNRTNNTKEKNNKEYTVIDKAMIHQDLDCDKCSRFVDTHIRLKRNAVIPSLKALAGYFRIDRVDSVGVHLLHLESIGIAKITSPNGDPWTQGQSKMIKMDFSDYESTQDSELLPLGNNFDYTEFENDPPPYYSKVSCADCDKGEFKANCYTYKHEKLVNHIEEYKKRSISLLKVAQGLN